MMKSQRYSFASLVAVILLLFWTGGCALVEPVEKAETLPVLAGKGENPKTISLSNMDIPRLLQVAMKKNPGYQIARSRVKEARGKLLEASSGLYPRIQFSAHALRGDSPADFFLARLQQRKFSFGGNLNQPGEFGTTGAKAEIKYRFNLAGATLFSRWLAQSEIAMGKARENEALNFLVFSIIQAYYHTLASEKYIEVARQSVKTIESQLKETKVKYKNGSALKTDVLALEVRLASAREEVIKAENQWRLLQSSLAVLIGIEPTDQLTLKEKPWDPVPLPSTKEKGLAEALRKRSELKEAAQNFLRSQYGEKLAASTYFPNLELFGDYSFEDRDFGYNQNRDNWKIGAGLSWTVFEGFRRRGKTTGAEARREMAAQKYRQVQLRIRREVDEAYRNWEEAKKRVEVLKLAVEQATENLELVRKQFEGGAATITRYLNAELAYSKARFQLVTARYDLKRAKAAVGHALGLCGDCARGL